MEGFNLSETATKTEKKKLVQVRNMIKHFPVENSLRSGHVQWMEYPLIFCRAKPSDWWANPVAVNQPWGAACLRLA